MMPLTKKRVLAIGGAQQHPAANWQSQKQGRGHFCRTPPVEEIPTVWQSPHRHQSYPGKQWDIHTVSIWQGWETELPNIWGPVSVSISMKKRWYLAIQQWFTAMEGLKRREGCHFLSGDRDPVPWTCNGLGFLAWCHIPPPKKVLLLQTSLFKLIQVIAQVVQFDPARFWLTAWATVMLGFLDVKKKLWHSQR